MTYYLSTTPYRLARRWALRPTQAEERLHSLPVNIREEDESFIFSALVPGLKADDLNIEVLEDVVTIEGEFHHDGMEYLVRELPAGKFRRSLRLPAELDAGQAEARIKDGILTLRVPKAESARPKMIKVIAK